MSRHSGYRIANLLFVGLLFHVCYIGTVFDCYFTSPVVSGMQRHKLQTPESKRLVLIVGDGLRADLLFSVNGFNASVHEAPLIVAPYLRSVVESRGAFGISHTRVPTESRPGHVALIGGMYEDVSAVTKGWKTNPVDFDSVFNQSSHTFSFGSPDILPMFSRGATPGKVLTWTYNEDDEDFTKDATALDVWVLDQLRSLLHNATTDRALDLKLRDNKVVFFLHLLGLDTTGHSYRPHSKEYMNNIMVVDNIVRQTEALLSEFYQDDDTSFIFTADHGMSVIGNHGDGDPDNTRTPLIAWGKGIRGPMVDSSPTSHDSYSEPWHLGHLLRRDVEQADVTAIMSALLGTDWPINSVGVLPDIDPSRAGYLLPHDGKATLAEAGLVNAKVIVEHYRVKHEMKRAHSLFYKPFPDLEGIKPVEIPPRVRKLADIEGYLLRKDWYTARQKSVELIQSSLAGLRYLQTYDRFLIRGIVLWAYTGWAAYASLFIFRPGKSGPDTISSVSKVIALPAGVVLLSFWAFFAIQKSPWTFYLYIVFPVYFWHQFIAQVIPVASGWVKTNKWIASNYVKTVTCSLLTVGVLQGMVLAYTNRPLWSLGCIIGVAWPFIALPIDVVRKHARLLATWSTACFVMAIFPLLAVDMKESLLYILLGGAGILVTGFVSALHVSRAPGGQVDLRLRGLFGIQLLLIVLTMGITTASTLSLQAKNGLPLWSQVSGWLALITSSLIPIVSWVKHSAPASKLLMFFLGFGSCFVLLSISVEGLFYLTYSITLFLWIEVEALLRANLRGGKETQSPGAYRFRADDLRIAMFFLFFVQIGFFGTGNVASISSFYLEPVYRLVPIFNPFLMATLLIFKIVAPYVVLSAAFATLNARLSLPPFSLFLVALTLTDVMTITFFFKVTDTGSWLEIGQSISFFCITSLLLVWSAGICAAGEVIMKDTLVGLAARMKLD